LIGVAGSGCALFRPACGTSNPARREPTAAERRILDLWSKRGRCIALGAIVTQCRMAFGAAVLGCIMEFKSSYFEALQKLARQVTANQIALQNVLVRLHPSQQHQLPDLISSQLRAAADANLDGHPEILQNNFPGLFDLTT